MALSTIITLNHDRTINPGDKKKRELLRILINYLHDGLGGAVKITSFDLFPNGTAPVAAAGTVTIVGPDAGTYTTTINGVGINATGINADATATAAAIAAAINASTNALVQFIVTATSALGVVTITAAQKSIYGNAITLAASGTGATASGTRLTGGTGGNVAVNSNIL